MEDKGVIEGTVVGKVLSTFEGVGTGDVGRVAKVRHVVTDGKQGDSWVRSRL